MVRSMSTRPYCRHVGKIKEEVSLWSCHNDRPYEGRNRISKRVSECEIWITYQSVTLVMVCVIGSSVTGHMCHNVGVGTRYRNEFQTKNYFTISKVALLRIRKYFIWKSKYKKRRGFDPSLSHRQSIHASLVDPVQGYSFASTVFHLCTLTDKT